MTARWRILQGDCRAVLRTLAEKSVHTAVTSPPYYGLRDYGIKGQRGLERTVSAYLSAIVDDMREVRRVLRDDGTLWLNLGDCYATGAGKVGECPGGGEQGARWCGEGSKHDTAKGGAQMGPRTQPNRLPIPGLKPKDLVGAPWRVAFALQADGWYLRSDIIWSKPNPRPESVTDRPTKAHEYIFLLSKSERYYYDHEAIKEPAIEQRSGNASRVLATGENGARPADHLGSSVPWSDDGTGRNRRTVWTVATQPFAEDHFATFPPKLIEPCILAGAPVGGVVLDPFNGAGTTGLVATRLQREYIGMSRRRIEGDAPLFNRLAVGE